MCDNVRSSGPFYIETLIHIPLIRIVRYKRDALEEATTHTQNTHEVKV